MIREASPGHDAKYYAELVLRRILESEKNELENTLQLEQGLPSFLEQTVDIKRKSIRHSSPKKVRSNSSSKIPKRLPFANITNSKSIETNLEEIPKIVPFSNITNSKNIETNLAEIPKNVPFANITNSMNIETNIMEEIPKSLPFTNITNSRNVETNLEVCKKVL